MKGGFVKSLELPMHLQLGMFWGLCSGNGNDDVVATWLLGHSSRKEGRAAILMVSDKQISILVLAFLSDSCCMWDWPAWHSWLSALIGELDRLTRRLRRTMAAKWTTLFPLIPPLKMAQCLTARQLTPWHLLLLLLTGPPAYLYL